MQEPIFMLIPFDELVHRQKIIPRGVLHLGANTGQEAEMYHQLGFSPVIWVEAIPTVHSALERHIAQFPAQVALCACVSDTDEQWVKFHISSNQAQSSSFLEF